MVVGVDERRAWRASTGSCADGGAVVQATSDGGTSWSKEASPSRAIARAQPLSGSRGFVYGAGKDCALREYVTTDGGSTWRETQAVAGVWSRSVRDAREVSTPADATSKPCGDQGVLDLLRTSATGARVLCLDGALKRTSNAGAKWTDAGTVSGGLALSGRVEGDAFAVYAARVSDTCKGVEVVRVTEAKPGVTGCVETDAEAAPGEIDLSTPAQTGWLVVGDETWTSADLKTWKRA